MNDTGVIVTPHFYASRIVKKSAILTRRHRECRIALVLDLENLVHGHRAAGDWGNAVKNVAGALRDLRYM